MPKLTVEQQRELISDDAVHVAFLRRDDIKCLPAEEQQRRWDKHKIGLDRFREFLSGCDSIVVPSPKREAEPSQES